jgi:hypothetical protein
LSNSVAIGSPHQWQVPGLEASTKSMQTYMPLAGQPFFGLAPQQGWSGTPHPGLQNRWRSPPLEGAHIERPGQSLSLQQVLVAGTHLPLHTFSIGAQQVLPAQARPGQFPPAQQGWPAPPQATQPLPEGMVPTAQL